jgi:hypothetical protein
MFDQLLKNAESRFTIDFTDTQSNDLKQYCKIENIMLSSLIPDGKPKSTIKLRLQLVACNFLKRIDSWLRIIIDRLISDIERSGRVRRQIS